MLQEFRGKSCELRASHDDGIEYLDNVKLRRSKFYVNSTEVKSWDRRQVFEAKRTASLLIRVRGKG